MTLLRAILLLIAAAFASPCWAVPITIAKTGATISDPLNTALQPPKAIPGATVEFTVVIANASGNPNATGVAYVDAIPPGATMCVASFDLLNASPVPFTDLSLLASSGITSPYTSVTDINDYLDFSKDHGVNWNYAPNAALGCDPQITDIRVRFLGTFRAAKSVQLKYRLLVK